jgi:hypothetical protein
MPLRARPCALLAADARVRASLRCPGGECCAGWHPSGGLKGMANSEEDVRAYLDPAFPGRWHTVPEPGADPIRWVNQNAADLIRVNTALREAMIGLAKELDVLRDEVRLLKDSR